MEQAKIDKFKKDFRAEMDRFKGKGMDDQKIQLLCDTVLKRMALNREHVHKIGPQKLAAMSIIMHAKELATDKSGNKPGGSKPKKG